MKRRHIMKQRFKLALNFCGPVVKTFALLSWRTLVSLRGGVAAPFTCSVLAAATLSLWNLGAQSVVGVDINARMLACAAAKSHALGAPAQWYCSDILHTPHELDATADLVYTGRGALCWLMDLKAWAEVIVRLLKPGGKLYVFDGHPLDWLWDGTSSHYRFEADAVSYFQREPVSSLGWSFSYIPVESQAKQPATKWERQWTLGDIVNALLAADLRLLRLEEHPDRYWDIFPNMPPELQDRLPHTFSLWMEKPAG